MEMNRRTLATSLAGFLLLAAAPGCGTMEKLFSSDDGGPEQVNELVASIERVYVNSELSKEKVRVALDALGAIAASEYKGDALHAYTKLDAAVTDSEEHAETLRASVRRFDDPALEAPLVSCLAAIRLLHVDAVDAFLAQIGASEAFQRQVAAAAEVELVRRYIYGLGIYNTSVHQALNYPKMRRQLLMGSLSSLARARSAQDFMTRYSLVPIRMARETLSFMARRNATRRSNCSATFSAASCASRSGRRTS